MTRCELLAMIPRRAYGVEFGVLHGASAAYIWRTVRPKHLILIDNWSGTRRFWGKNETRYHHVLDRFDDQIRAGEIEVRREEAMASLGEIRWPLVDFVHLDIGVDSHAGLLAAACWRRMKRGAMMAARGYNHDNPENKATDMYDQLIDIGAKVVAISERALNDTPSILLEKD